MTSPIRLTELATAIGAAIVAPSSVNIAAVEITGLASLDEAGPGQISHLSSVKFRPLLAESQATAVICAERDVGSCPGIALQVDNPYVAYAKATQLFRQPRCLEAGIHDSAVVHPSASIDASACIGPGVVVGADTVVAARVQIRANTVVGDRCNIQEGTCLMSQVAVYDDVKIGAESIIHSAAVIGADGFGWAPDENGHLHEIAQLGGVTIGDRVSIGAGSAVDRGALTDTVIETGVKIDNLVQIGHNSRVGAHTVICGSSGMAGSTRFGKHCVLAGRVSIGGDGPITICDRVVVSVGTTVTRSISTPGTYSASLPALPHAEWMRNAASIKRLAKLVKQVTRLERRLNDE